MFNPVKYYRESTAFRTWCVLFLAFAGIYLVMEKLNARDQMADFRVYFDAAKAWLNSESMYGKAFGVSSGYYKYSPVATVPFMPFTYISYNFASSIFYLIIALGLLIFTSLLMRNQEKMFDMPKYRAWLLFFFSIFIADHIERELHLGNINLFLMLLALMSFFFLVSGKRVWSGILYGCILLFKPHFLLLLPWFIWKKEWKVLLSAVCFFVAGIFIPSIFVGWNDNLELLSEWVNSIRGHNVHLQQSPNTIYGILNSFVLLPMGLNGGKILIVAVLAMVASLFLWWMIRSKKSGKPADPQSYLEYFLLIALIPNLAHTDTEHFMWSFPLVAFSLAALLNKKIRHKWIYILMLIAAVIPYTFNSPDIVGRTMMKLFDEGGLLGVANLLIIATAVGISGSVLSGLRPAPETTA